MGDVKTKVKRHAYIVRARIETEIEIRVKAQDEDMAMERAQEIEDVGMDFDLSDARCSGVGGDVLILNVKRNDECAE